MTNFYPLVALTFWAVLHLQAQTPRKSIIEPQRKIDQLRIKDTTAAPKTDALFPEKPNEKLLLTDTRQEEYSTGVYVEQMPEFPGGMQALQRFISNNLQQPPDAKCKGKVYISFIVKEDGAFSDIKVIKGLSQVCDGEAVRLVNSMPKWKPGRQSGRNIAVRYSFPIRFY